MSDDFIIDKLKERTTGKILYPITILEALRGSEDENSKNLKQILETNGIPLNYELYGYAVCLANPNPQTRISYFEMAKGKRPAFWNYVNGYFDYGDWSHAFFIRNCFPCMVKYDGTIDYKLDPENYNLKEDGTASDVANKEYEGSAMTAIPTIWTKRWQDDNYLYCLICDRQLDPDFKAYMHTRSDGTVAKYKYIAMYPATLYTDVYKSLSNQVVTASKNFETEMMYTHNIGENWEIFSLSDWATIGDLLTLISKSDNLQTSFGYGMVNNSAVSTNSDPGTTRFGGLFFNSAALNTNSHQKLFHIHQLYGNISTRLSGIVYNQGVLHVKPNPPYNLTGDDYINTEITFSGSNGYIKESKMTEYARVPFILGGSATTYECDQLNYSNTILAIPYLQSVYSWTTRAGKLGLICDALGTVTQPYISPRITCFSVDSIEADTAIEAIYEL